MQCATPAADAFFLGINQVPHDKKLYFHMKLIYNSIVPHEGKVSKQPISFPLSSAQAIYVIPHIKVDAEYNIRQAPSAEYMSWDSTVDVPHDKREKSEGLYSTHRC